MYIVDLRKRIFIIGSIVVALFIAGILLYLLFRDQSQDTPASSLVNDSSSVVETIPSDPEFFGGTPITPALPPEKLRPLQTARIFVERFQKKFVLRAPAHSATGAHESHFSKTPGSGR